jgi:hypothetical protein
MVTMARLGPRPDSGYAKPRNSATGTEIATKGVSVSERDMPKLIVFVLALLAVSLSLVLSVPS